MKNRIKTLQQLLPTASVTAAFLTFVLGLSFITPIHAQDDQTPSDQKETANVEATKKETASVEGAKVANGVLKVAVDESQPRMVKVYGASAGRVDGYATGVIVSNEGHILTTRGVFLDGRTVRVVTSDGKTHNASVLKRDRVLQVALLQLQIETPMFFELTDQPVSEKGDWVVAISNAFKVAEKTEALSATLGVVSLRSTIEARYNKRDVAYMGDVVLIDCITSNPGAAGGAVVTLDGQLVGMIGRVINSTETNTRLNYAIPSHLLKRFLEGDEDVVAAEKPESEKGDLGIKLFKLGGRNNPAYIDRVVRGGPAAEVGLKPDDLIISIAGQTISTVTDYNEAVETLSADQEILMIVKRGSSLIRFPITPTAKK